MAGRWALLSRVPQTASTIDYTASAPPLPPADLTTDALSADAPPPPPFILHTLARSDTLIGLSFKYRVSEHDIRRLNDLPSDNLFTGGPTLRIPTSAMPRGMSAREAVPADTRAAVLRRFRVENGLEDSEARFYLVRGLLRESVGGRRRDGTACLHLMGREAHMQLAVHVQRRTRPQQSSFPPLPFPGRQRLGSRGRQACPCSGPHL